MQAEVAQAWNMSIGIVAKHSIKKKNSFPYLKCVLRLSCVVHGPIYITTHKTAPINRPLDWKSESGQKKHKTKQINWPNKCCAAVNRKFCCNVYNFALVYQVIFCLG